MFYIITVALDNCVLNCCCKVYCLLSRYYKFNYTIVKKTSLPQMTTWRRALGRKAF